LRWLRQVGEIRDMTTVGGTQQRQSRVSRVINVETYQRHRGNYCSTIWRRTCVMDPEHGGIMIPKLQTAVLYPSQKRRKSPM